MIKVFSINELVNCAVQIEKSGAAFYNRAASITKNDQIAKLFKYLAEQEIDHEKTFQKILDDVELNVNPGTVYSDEYYRYIRLFIDDIVFRKGIPEVSDELEAMKYAIDKEKESILFYMEMKQLVSAKHGNLIDRIIDEERVHILNLLDMQEKIA